MVSGLLGDIKHVEPRDAHAELVPPTFFVSVVDRMRLLGGRRAFWLCLERLNQ